ncbi:plasmid pRiA4b ORF-3 family protein [Thiorhodococcus mannitoliphagus]|uniref:Plasmid pRiA4b ORF-3 family protein n=1 Tax=Thiorhodococcus mannitoliphagus TaxID=329406 RepID=A0A6P1DMP0_9GAMM|nr:plasmid pRiA4b ORF-3 family protein [Thiorhodococcus mannitoliphagus]NEX18800.1 plasmid pRiA4b ORF-3 family protein [Thiorhodococcus mannitoliphagus]
MIWTLDIKLIRGRWATGDWSATIAIDAAATLDDLHLFIQRTLDFDNDHLSDFFVARTPTSAKRTRCRFDATLEDLFPLPKGHKLFYLFDYGDNWLFQIGRTRKKPFEPEPDSEYLRLISEQGEKPRQYPAFD